MKQFLLLLVAFVFLALTGCQTAEVVEPTQVTESEEAEATQPTVTPLVALPAETDHCLECHTDKDALVALATEAEDAHGSESEGVG